MSEHTQTIKEYYELQEQMANHKVEAEQVMVAQERPTPKALDVSFMAKGSCKDLPPSYMFGQDSGEVEAAKVICRNCVVVEICAEYALASRVNSGVWGGMSERERRGILKLRQAENTNK